MLHSICQQIGKLSIGHRTGKSQFSFQSQRKTMPKNVQTTAQLHSSHMPAKYNAQNSPSQASTVHELWTSRCPSWIYKRQRNQRLNFQSIESSKKQEIQKNIYFCFIDYTKAFDCVDHNKLWKILQEMEIPNHLSCLLRNLYAGKEATVRMGHGTIDRYQIGKGVCQGCILSPCLFNLCGEYIMWNAGLDDAHAGIKIAGRKISNLRYADDATLMAESEEPKSLLMTMKEESLKVGLKLNIQKAKIMASGPITS